MKKSNIPHQSNQKRKAQDVGKTSTKKMKTTHNSSKSKSSTSEYLDELPMDQWGWNEVDGIVTGDGDDYGFLCLEELDGVDVELESAGVGKRIRFKKIGESKPGKSAKPLDPLEEVQFIHIDEFDSKAPPARKQKVQKDSKVQKEQPQQKKESKKKEQQPVQAVDISEWTQYGLHSKVVESLSKLGLTKPTEIQAKTLPVAITARHDVIGAAETGSGKTLAFGLPILHHIAQHEERDGISALILTPTRELALQVGKMLRDVGHPFGARITTIVGGMAVQKQERQLSSKPDVVVATAGRLWELASEDRNLLDRLKNIRFLVLDEADRMLEFGHFKELEQLLQGISKKKKHTSDWSGDAEQVAINNAPKRQTFIFSATLIKETQLKKTVKKGSVKVTSSTPTFEQLFERVEFEDAKPQHVDVTKEKVVAEKVVEARIDCLANAKDAMLYYFLLRYPGRTLVFVNSIDAIRRLLPIFQLLQVPVMGLHAQMQQRQRLKNLDRFREKSDAVLIASDVAARGLDIPNVQHVIHYQLPRNAETYVHRSGRAGRAGTEGMSLLLVTPEELKQFRLIQRSLNTLRSSDGDLPEFPVDRGLVTEAKKRTDLATKIDTLQHRQEKQNHEKNWIKKMAEEMDIEADEDILGPQETGSNKETKMLKAQLQDLLKRPLIPKGITQKYVASIQGLADTVLQNSSQAMPTVKAKSAIATLKK